ncbi:hypothetical protein BG011_008975 [Mortierella polycephala]|uniref:C3H1-type domain-containing protein n=1 Tax=Mortierella polycephala TaxID=41804 RepID=A0A9P6PNY5_9FUNG|nr:hypothetical protein BG011_008975 [Mortierella polycephala]
MNAASPKERAPAPLDADGNEICFLFLKYGKCRYGKKCKKSHSLPDKNAPIMKRITPVAEEKPAVRSGPRITFSVRKTPYSKPSSVTPAGTAGTSGYKSGRLITPQHQGQRSVMEKNAIAVDRATQEQSLPSAPTTSIATATNVAVDVPMQSSEEQKSTKKRKSKPRRPVKEAVNCLLSSLFQTTIPPETVSRHHNLLSTSWPARSIQKPSRTKRNIGQKQKSKSTPALHQRPSLPAVSAAPSFSTNEQSTGGEKVEQWYITNKARLDPKTRRLMVLTKPTTLRQKMQLKAMRKHHWECGTEIERQLKRNVPTAFSLKITRSRIDWDKVAPYVALMIQAALEMNIEDQHLPVLGTTLCALLEHKELTALACEELLVSWGLTTIDARRFTSHLWEVMIAAAGEATIRTGVQATTSRASSAIAIRLLHTEGEPEGLNGHAGTRFDPAIPGDEFEFLPGDKITGETQIGEYPNIPMYNRQWRDGSPSSGYWDLQDRRPFGETVPEEDELLNIFSPDVSAFPVSLGVKGILAAAAAFIGFGYLVNATRPEPHFTRRTYPDDGLLEALGIDPSDKVMVEKRGARA